MTRLEALESLKANHPAGEKLVELSLDELNRTYGGGDVDAEWSPAIYATVYALRSSKWCAAGAGAGAGAVFSWITC
ncbi:mersacidin family lantibiotic [Paenibacillus xerothermodurans]|uniref:Type 2 lantibiotic n=1 Tax=Paenibacillus xerothermodurans TaxID=1977292 RepID=A0A2W1N858_PAEXE|nr:mersacidin family lantibiotic [Paenibacillus xerothermodurans]PZE20044.1 type 2 lantibiotic [Paenibacillus xerothermodurans]